MITSASERLETAIHELTKPLNGQYPRPWMTELTNPLDAEMFTVGKNQRNGFDVQKVGSQDHYIDSIYNRGSERCRQLYDRLTGTPSPTRRNTDALVSMLRASGVSKVLETNVVCYSTPMSADLRKATHAGGAERGTEIFTLLLNLIQPRVIIAHGSDTAKRLGRIIGHPLPAPPAERCRPSYVLIDRMAIFIIPSLAPPQFNKWAAWSREYLADLSAQAADFLRHRQEG